MSAGRRLQTPRTLDFLADKGLTPGEKYIWEQANRAIQLGQEIGIPTFARLCEVSERFAQLTLAKLARLGLLLAESRPGKRTGYRLPPGLWSIVPPKNERSEVSR